MSFSDERDYAEEQWQRDEAEREGLAEQAIDCLCPGEVPHPELGMQPGAAASAHATGYGPDNPQCSAVDEGGLDCAAPEGHASDHANASGTWPYAESDDGEHCRDGYSEDRYGDDMGGPTSCTDVDGGGECVHCECCCSCLGCEYGDRNSPPMTEEQRAPIAAFEATDGELAREAREAGEEPGDPDFDNDVPPNAGSAS